jgi:hypothetical protein
MNENIVFVYVNKEKILILNHEKAKKQHDKLLIDGYKHVATLDATIFIAYLFEKHPELLKEFNNE